jgi:hypothetical protein
VVGPKVDPPLKRAIRLIGTIVRTQRRVHPASQEALDHEIR